MARTNTCVHCVREGTERTVEWNPVNGHWQCRDVVRCAKTIAERKLESGLRRAMRRQR